jgi:hypothetical protein
MVNTVGRQGFRRTGSSVTISRLMLFTSSDSGSPGIKDDFIKKVKKVSSKRLELVHQSVTAVFSNRLRIDHIPPKPPHDTPAVLSQFLKSSPVARRTCYGDQAAAVVLDEAGRSLGPGAGIRSVFGGQPALAIAEPTGFCPPNWRTYRWQTLLAYRLKQIQWPPLSRTGRVSLWCPLYVRNLA